MSNGKSAPNHEDERKGGPGELGKSPSIPPGDDFPSEQDVEEELPGVPEEPADPATERGDE